MIDKVLNVISFLLLQVRDKFSLHTQLTTEVLVSLIDTSGIRQGFGTSRLGTTSIQQQVRVFITQPLSNVHPAIFKHLLSYINVSIKCDIFYNDHY